MTARVEPDCYDYPQYWDLAFRDETRLEAEFLQAAARKYCRFSVQRMLEPGCGGGRLVVEMAARGYQLVGFDLNPKMVSYVKRRLRRRHLSAEVFQADMTEFCIDPKVDVAFCTFNTFRHLTSERAAVGFLESLVNSLRRGGICVLGFHLLPPDADESCVERWSARHGRTVVNMTLRVLECDRQQRLERIRFSMRVNAGSKRLRLQSDYEYRLYTADQVCQLLAKVPAFELCDVFDFWYEIDHPLQLNDELGDAVFVLRKQ